MRTFIFHLKLIRLWILQICAILTQHLHFDSRILKLQRLFWFFLQGSSILSYLLLAVAQYTLGVMLLPCLTLSVKLWKAGRIIGRIHQHSFSANNLPDYTILLPSIILLLKDDSESQYSEKNFISAWCYCGCCICWCLVAASILPTLLLTAASLHSLCFLTNPFQTISTRSYFYSQTLSLL